MGFDESREEPAPRGRWRDWRVFSVRQFPPVRRPPPSLCRRADIRRNGRPVPSTARVRHCLRMVYRWIFSLLPGDVVRHDERCWFAHRNAGANHDNLVSKSARVGTDAIRMRRRDPRG
jgi:hypothetical protein